MARIWVDLTTIDNNTAIYNIAWYGDQGFSTKNDTWFSEQSGLTTDSQVDQASGWRAGKSQAMGWYTYHRMSNTHKKYSCTFLDQYYTGNGSTVEYGVAMTDASINQLPTGTISGNTYYMLNITDWQNWKPLYMPLSTSKIQSTYVPGKIMVEIDNPVTISVDPETIQAVSEPSSYTVTLQSEGPWSATTIPSWISLSSTAGTESAEITATIAQNNTYSQRTGTIVFTASNGDTAEIECTQDKHPILVPVNKLYKGGLVID